MEVVRSFLDFIERTLRDGHRTVPERSRPRVRFGLDGSYSVESLVEIDYGSVAAFSLLDFVKMPEHEAVMKTLVSHPQIARLLTDKGVGLVPMAFAYNVLQPMVTKQLYLQKGVEFDQRSFESNYASFEDYLFGDRDEYVFTAPLANFDMDRDSENVGPFVIRKLDADEFTFYNGITTDPSSLAARFPLAPHEFAVQLSATVRRGAPPLTPLDQDRIWWIVALMKLIHDGSVSYENIWVRPVTWAGMSFGMGSLLTRIRTPGRPYVLRPQDISELRELWQKAEPSVGVNQPFWTLALHRFYDAVDRIRSDEALIDFWIACESLFGEDIELGELTYRLSLRIAHFLGTDAEQRESIRDMARDAYRVRGLLVHGRARIDQTRLAGQTRAMEDLTRKAIRKCLVSSYPSRDEMIRQVETSILGGQVPPPPYADGPT